MKRKPYGPRVFPEDLPKQEANPYSKKWQKRLDAGIAACVGRIFFLKANGWEMSASEVMARLDQLKAGHLTALVGLKEFLNDMSDSSRLYAGGHSKLTVNFNEIEWTL